MEMRSVGLKYFATHLERRSKNHKETIIEVEVEVKKDELLLDKEAQIGLKATPINIAFI